MPSRAIWWPCEKHLDSFQLFRTSLKRLGRNDALPLKLLDPCEEELSLLQATIEDEPPATLQNTGIIRPGYSDELDGVIESSRHARDWIANLEATERKRTGLKTLKVGYNKVFGYYIEISRGAADKAPEDYIRKQTLVNAERLHHAGDEGVRDTGVERGGAHPRDRSCGCSMKSAPRWASRREDCWPQPRALAELDVLSALAEAAALGGYSRPEVRDDALLDIREGRHPVVEHSLRSERYVPNDVIV